MDETVASGRGDEAVADSNSDWEYEYSATETETHLVTVDLSIPDFIRRKPDHIVHNTRGGFRPWMQPLMTGDSPKTSKSKAIRENGNDGLEQEDRGPVDDATDIQILDLHGTQPVLAYRGVVFTGAWTENIGTEMLFAEQQQQSDAPDLLPVRHLPQKVDLLGASTARIACTPVDLRPRAADRAWHKVSPKKKPFVIPVSGNASVARQHQASFLEQLMAVKRSRGETDVVTVQAVETPHDAVQDDAEEERLRKRKELQVMRYQRRLQRHHAAAAAAGGAGGAGSSGLGRTHYRGRQKVRSPAAQVAGVLGGAEDADADVDHDSDVAMDD